MNAEIEKAKKWLETYKIQPVHLVGEDMPIKLHQIVDQALWHMLSDYSEYSKSGERCPECDSSDRNSHNLISHGALVPCDDQWHSKSGDAPAGTTPDALANEIKESLCRMEDVSITLEPWHVQEIARILGAARASSATPGKGSEGRG